MPLEMNKVKHRYMDTFCFHNSAKGACQFPLGVEKKKRANQLQCIGLYIESCLAAARTARNADDQIVHVPKSSRLPISVEKPVKFSYNIKVNPSYCIS